MTDTIELVAKMVSRLRRLACVETPGTTSSGHCYPASEHIAKSEGLHVPTDAATFSKRGA